MKFLKTIQKREVENPTADESLLVELAPDETRNDNVAAGVLGAPELRIGAPRRNADAIAEAAPAAGVQPASAVVIEAEPKGAPYRSIRVNVERVNPRVVSITHPRSPYCEEYRNLRTQLLHKSKRIKLQAIVVASVGPGEGKSVSALNLSWLFAQTDGVRALIIDSDLRRPSLAGYLGVEGGVGLSEVLAGEAALTSAIVKLEPSGLHLLPGGSPRDDVAELLSGPRFAEILKEARQSFDFIVIDAPPLGIFTDASLLINLADGALLVIRANHTKYKDVDRILDALPRERVLGTILNQSEVPLMDESYYKYGFYGRSEEANAQT